MTKLALVTGGSRGIGAATVGLLRERGWDVLAPTRKQVDFSSDSDILRLGFKRGAQPMDAAIFCHGEWFSGEPLMDDWRKQFVSRVLHPWVVMQGLLRVGLQSVVMVSSTRGFIGGVNTGPYAAACAAQIALMQGYAREWPGVRFNAVCPGLTDTDMGKQVLATGGAKAGAVPQPARAVAEAIVGLVEGNETGQVLRVVDGAVTRARWVWE